MGMHGKFDDLGRFADPSLLILTSLSDEPKHGYAIMADVAAFSGVRMEPGTPAGTPQFALANCTLSARHATMESSSRM